MAVLFQNRKWSVQKAFVLGLLVLCMFGAHIQHSRGGYAVVASKRMLRRTQGDPSVRGNPARGSNHVAPILPPQGPRQRLLRK